MAKTVEELMRPRYKVIADYPGQRFQIGDVIETYETTMCYAIGNSPHSEPEWSEKVSLIDYPAIFMKLEWWEDRQKEDMPQFVKSKFACWVNDTIYEEGQIVKIISINRLANDDLSFFLPSTEQEYNDYIKSKEQTNG